jgi:hypothetical protein
MIIAALYLSAWAIYYTHARTDTIKFKLPLQPVKVLQINYALVGLFTGWISYFPIIVSYLYWRYWDMGTERFKKIVRCVCVC